MVAVGFGFAGMVCITLPTESGFSLALAMPILLNLTGTSTSAQTSTRDQIAEIITGSTPRPAQRLAEAKLPVKPQPDASGSAAKDPRAGDKDYEQARNLMRAIGEISNLLKTERENSFAARTAPINAGSLSQT